MHRELDPIACGVRRFRAPDVRHLSLINFPCGGGTTLFGLVGSKALQGLDLAERTHRIRHGLRCLAAAFHPDILYVGGGLTEAPEVRAGEGYVAATRILWSHGRRFVGTYGGQRIAGPSAIVFDVGQSAVKVSYGLVRRVYPRPPSKSPQSSSDLTGIEFLRNVLARELSASPGNAPVVLALPGEISDDLVPGHCSYRWAGRSQLLGELLPSNSASTREVLVLNDAELAAESARVELQPRAGAICLVLTLGFAPGGALLTPGGGLSTVRPGAGG